MIPILMHQMHRPKTLEIRYVTIVKTSPQTTTKKKKKIQNAVKWNQIHRKIELYMKEIILYFEMSLYFFFWTVKFISVFSGKCMIFRKVPRVL
jgi:hypothetical protein